eukprot:1952108-Prymnesium_polylepis.1
MARPCRNGVTMRCAHSFEPASLTQTHWHSLDTLGPHSAAANQMTDLCTGTGAARSQMWDARQAAASGVVVVAEVQRKHCE